MTSTVVRDPKTEAQAALALKPDARGIYRHYKGGTYILFAVSVSEAYGTHLVHCYSTERMTRWTRTWEDFFDASPVHASEQRFTKIREATRLDLLLACGVT